MKKICPENVRRITATVGGKTCCFRSEGEFLWAQYLDFLKRSGEIKDWDYEQLTFLFRCEKTAPVQYTPDFWVEPIKGKIYYQEFKRGYLDGQAITKLRRFAKHYPDDTIELVMMNMPGPHSKSKYAKRNAHRLYIARKYCRRIVDASAIFRQMGSFIKSAKDYLEAEKLTNEVFGESKK